MNCDQVFNILTRGPFPTGNSYDGDVESHLDQCHECWQLAEALRPALDVFQESVPPAESRDLPGYWSDSRPAAAVVAELSRQATGAAPLTIPRRATARLPLRPAPQTDQALLRDVLTVVGFITVMTVAVIGTACLVRLL